MEQKWDIKEIEQEFCAQIQALEDIGAAIEQGGQAFAAGTLQQHGVDQRFHDVAGVTGRCVGVGGAGFQIRHHEVGAPGERNVLFTRNYLSQEGIPLHDEAALGMTPRKIYFQPKRGRTKIRGIREAHNRTIFERELEYRHRLRELQLPHEGEVFDL
jgi:hypothetical protein